MTETELVDSHAWLVPFVLWRYFCFRDGCDGWEDATSWAYEGLLDVARRFDPSRGCKFSTLASRCIRTYVLSGLTHARRKRRVLFENHMAPLLAVSREPPPWRRLEVADAVRSFEAGTDSDRRLIRLCVFEGFSYSQAGALLGVTKQAVQQRLKNALGRCRRRMEATR